MGLCKGRNLPCMHRKPDLLILRERERETGIARFTGSFGVPVGTSLQSAVPFQLGNEVDTISHLLRVHLSTFLLRACVYALLDSGLDAR